MVNAGLINTMINQQNEAEIRRIRCEKYRKRKEAAGEVQINIWLPKQARAKLDTLTKRFGNRSLAVAYLLEKMPLNGEITL